MERILYKEADGDITCRSRDFDKVFPTLYAYEETGMTPEQIVAMKGLHTARQELITENEKLKADHDFLLQKLRENEMCDACKHINKHFSEEPCWNCVFGPQIVEKDEEKDNWEWDERRE